MRRRNLVVLMASAVVLSSVSTWAAAERIRSPAEVAARTAPPVASPILVPVVEQVLTNRVVTRGTGNYGSPQKLALVGSSLKSGHRIVTGLPRVGSRMVAGDVLLTVSGRPVFLLQGRQPSYRDLGPGIRGQDVRQLERALAGGGFGPGVVDGVYDAATGSAVSRMYAAHGFEPVVATEAELARSRPTEAETVDGARASSGVQVPSDELVFVAKVPLRITERLARIGDEARGPLVTVTDSDVVIDGSMPVDQAGLVERGAKVIVDEPTLGLEATGRVAQVAGRPGTDGADGFHVHFEVDVPDPPPGLVGASVRLVIPIESTGTARLTVPVSAVTLGADGGSRVQRSVDGSTEFVPVQTGLSADGLVSVTPRSGSLVAGDLVVVGLRSGRRAGG